MCVGGKAETLGRAEHQRCREKPDDSLTNRCPRTLGSCGLGRHPRANKEAQMKQVEKTPHAAV